MVRKKSKWHGKKMKFIGNHCFSRNYAHGQAKFCPQITSVGLEKGMINLP